MNESTTAIQTHKQSLEDYDRSLGTDELNLCEFPLASLSTRTEPGHTTLRFEDSVFDTGAKATVHRTLLVTGSEHFGLPTATDNDILLLLMHLIKSQLEYDLRQFATEHIGLSRSYDNHEIKRKLKPALIELHAIGFLADSKPEMIFRRTKPGKWQITLRKSSPGVVENATSFRQETELTSRGISRNVAKKLAAEFSAEQIAEKIHIHDTLVANRDRRVSKNAAGFLAAAIRDDYRPPLPIAAKIRVYCRKRRKNRSRVSERRQNFRIEMLPTELKKPPF